MRRSTSFVSALVATAVLLAAATPAAYADETIADGDVLTTGTQSAVSVSAARGGTVSIPVDLYVECKTRNHIDGAITLTYNAGQSTLPAGGGATSVTINKPRTWPADDTSCPNPTPLAGPGRSTVTFTAPSTAGSYSYVVRWSSSDSHVTDNGADSQLKIALTVTQPAADTTPPVITKTVSGTSGAGGWYTSAVTVTWSVTDAQSAVVIDSGCGVQSFTSDAAAATSSCSAHSAGGSASDSVTLKIDRTAPTAQLSTSGVAGLNGWFTGDVTVTTTGADATSGVTCTPAQQQTAETAGQAFGGSCTNGAGLTTAAAPVTVKLDKTGPAASLAVTGGAPGTNGWYTSPVTVQASGADAISGVASCTPDVIVAADTAGTDVAGSCTNGAGLVTAAPARTVKLDTSDPTALLGVTSGTLSGTGWYTSDVTVGASGTDNVSNPTSCDPASQTLTEDTTSRTFDATCTNDAGRSKAAASLTIRRDATPPTATLHVTGTEGSGGWYTSDVVVETRGTDATSAVTCTTDQTFTAETTGLTVNGSCTDGAGNVTAAAPVTIKIDKTAPTALLSAAGTEGAAGWYTSNVAVTTSGADGISGVTCTAPQAQTEETQGTPFTGSCTNGAGLSTDAAALTVKVDKTAPAVSLATAGTQGANGWFTSDVAIDTVGSDAVSGIVSCTGQQQQTAETTGTAFGGSCTNGAGLAADAAPVTVKLDKSGPSATLSAAGAEGTDGWYTDDVTVSADGSDGISGGVTCTDDVVLSADTTGTDVTGSCTNAAGLTTQALPLTVKLDKSNPTAALAVAAGTLGTDGWYLDDVTVRTTGADNVSDPTTCTADQFLTVDTTGETFEGSCTNSAGRTEDADPLVVKRDASAPDAAYVVTGTQGEGGWYVSDVTVQVSGTDATSGVTCTGDVVLTRNTSGTDVVGSCTNGAGATTMLDPITIKIDKTAPTADLAVTAGMPGADGWYVSDVTVATTGTSGPSGLTCTAPRTFTAETAGREATGSCTNGAGVTVTATPLTLKIDKTAPTAALSAAGTEGDDGWFTSNVTVTTSGADAVSGVTCTAPQSQTAETAGAVFGGSCTNGAGLTTVADPITVKLDKTVPSVSLGTSGTQGANGWFTSDVTVDTTGSDPISGIASCTPAHAQTAETTGTDFGGSCTNGAGLTGDAERVTVKVDKTGPSAELAALRAPDRNGWYLDDVAVRATGTDDVSGDVTCTDDVLLAADTAGTAVAGSCTNGAGLTTAAQPLTVQVDKSDPIAALSVAAGTLGAGGWYVDDVTVRTTGADNVSDPTSCTEDQFLTEDTASRTFAGSCTNSAGRTTAAAPLTVWRDASAPAAEYVVLGTQGANGWYTSDVTVRVVGNDPTSGVTCTDEVVLTANTAGTEVPGSCTNGAGLTTTLEPISVKIDKTLPTAALAVTSGTAGTNGWYTSDVTVATSGTGGPSGLACTAPQSLTAETAGVELTGSCTNGAGVTTTASPLTVRIDKTAPTAALTASGPAGTNGWFVGDVTVTAAGADALSGIAACTAPQSLTGDTKGTTLNGSCTNGAGLTTNAAPVTVKLDRTAPVVTVTGLAGPYQLGTTPSAGCTTTDATSGVATSATATVEPAATVGTFTVTCSGALDNAGNAGGATATFSVVYRYDGVLQPINDTAHQTGVATSIFKAGSTVPVKFQLKRADGTIATPATAPQWLTPVRGSATSASVDESVYTQSATSGSTFRWDATAQQWIYNWNTKGVGAGFYYRIGLRLDDGQTYYVNIGLR